MQLAKEIEGAAVRIIKTDGEPWFVLADVCKVLDIGNPSMVASRLDDDEQSALSIADTSSNGVSQRRQFTIITESGLYSAIFLSRKKRARPCQGNKAQGIGQHHRGSARRAAGSSQRGNIIDIEKRGGFGRLCRFWD